MATRLAMHQENKDELVRLLCTYDNTTEAFREILDQAWFARVPMKFLANRIRVSVDTIQYFASTDGMPGRLVREAILGALRELYPPSTPDSDALREADHV